MSVLNVIPPISNTADLSALSKNEEATPFFTSRECSAAEQTELATRDFYVQAQKIEGVQVGLSGGETWREKTILVTIPDIFDKSADEVFDLELRIYDSYPLANLDVHVAEATAGI